MRHLEKLTCGNCGSDDVWFGATARWDIITQGFIYQLEDHTDYDWCSACGQTCPDTKEVQLTDLKDIALVAAHTPIFKSVRSTL